MIPFVNQVAQHWWTWMSDMFWQVSLLIVIVGVIDFAVRKWAWPQVRYTLWLLVLVKLVIPPTWSLPSGIVPRIAPDVHERIVQRISSPPGVPANETPVIGQGDLAGSPAAGETDLSAMSAAGVVALTWRAYAMVTWIAGMGLFVGMLLFRVKKLRRWHRQQRDGKTIPPWFHQLMVRTAERLGLDRVPAIVFSNEVVTPAVYGLLRPVMLLPAYYVETLSEEEAEHVLLHELAHLKRGDLIVHGIAMLLHIVYWFNPFLVWAGRQTKHVREMCCDLTIANVLREKTARYRKTLLDTARALLTESVEPGMGFLGVFEEPYRLVARLKWLEKETWRNRSMITAAILGVVVLMVPFVLPMAASERGSAGGKLVFADWSDDRPSGERAARVRGDGAGKQDRNRPESICITEVARTTEKRLWTTLNSRIDYVSEMWLGDGIAALHERDRTIICDLKKNYFCYINHDDSSYVETTIPVERAAILQAEIRWDYIETPWTGRVDRKHDPIEVLDLRCDAYRVEAWRVIDGDVVAEQRFMVWATTEAPFDLTAYYVLLANRRMLTPRDDRFLEELDEIEGLQMYLEYKEKKRFFKRVSTAEVVEIARKSPYEYTYCVPPGYRKKDRLRRRDL